MTGNDESLIARALTAARQEGLSGALVGISPCWACKQPFPFDPDTVPSIYIDPATGKPPDVDPQPGGMERALREPVCPTCVKRLNAAIRAAGKTPVWREDTP